jgi:F-type H+-transporting ATPase subunit delta
VLEELSAWVEMTRTSAELDAVFRNPTVPYEQKRNVIENLIARTRVRPTTANLLRVLLQNHRLGDIEEVARQFGQELDRRSGVVAAEVTTARPLPPEAQEALRRRLGGLTGREVRLRFAVDESLIGGVVTRIGSTVYDGSVRGQLQQVRQRMLGSA